MPAAVKELEKHELLDDTYLMFTSDNGYHIGAHRLGSGKLSLYEEDIRVPFYIRGPGISKGSISHDYGLHVDLLPTILSLAGFRNLPTYLDGQPLDLFLPQPSANSQRAAAAADDSCAAVATTNGKDGGTVSMTGSELAQVAKQDTKLTLLGHATADLQSTALQEPALNNLQQHHISDNQHTQSSVDSRGQPSRQQTPQQQNSNQQQDVHNIAIPVMQQNPNRT